MTADNVQGKMARGAVWMMLLTMVDRCIGLVSTLLLVRILAPADFGIVAMALSFVLVAQLLSAFGFDVALIHNRDATPDHYHSAWTLNVVLGVVIMSLTLIAAAPLADFYNEPNVFWVVVTLAFWPLIGGFENIGVVAFRKDLDFRKEFAFQISRKIVGFLVTVPLAFWLRNHWALVVGTLASRAAGTVTSYLVHSFRPRFSLRQAGSLLKFSKWLLLNNVLILIRERTSDFLVGRWSGSASLGVYNITAEFSNMPVTEIGAPVNRALLPGFAKLVDTDAVVRAYSNAMSMLALAVFPAASGILAVAPFFVPVVLGVKWIDGVPLMEVMAVSSMFLVMQASISAVLIGRGFPRVVMQSNIVSVLLLVSSMLLLVPRFGAIGAAWSVLFSASCSTPMFLHHVRARIGVPLRTYLRAIARPIGASLVMIGVVRLALPDYQLGMPFVTAAGWLAAGVAIGVVVYLATIAGLWLQAGRPASAERHVLDLILSRLRRFGPAR